MGHQKLLSKIIKKIFQENQKSMETTVEKGETSRYLAHNIIVQGLLMQLKPLKSSKLHFSYVNTPPYTPKKNVKYSLILAEEN